MAVTNGVSRRVGERPAVVTAVLTVIGYFLVVGTFAGWIDVYPDLSAGTVTLLTHLIAIVNMLALACLVAGVYYIRSGDVRRHQIAMLSAFAFIMLFLVVYLFRVGGGFEKAIVAPELVTAIYLVMLAIHILLSIVAMPVVLYAVLLGLTRTTDELRGPHKRRIGRIGATAWIVSLALGIVTYLLLNHLYGSEPRALLLFALAAPIDIGRIGGGFHDCPISHRSARDR